MSQKSLTGWLKAIILITATLSLLAFLCILFVIGPDMVNNYPEFSNRYLPWVIFITIIFIPYFIALGLSWPVTLSIEDKTVFSIKNAKIFKSVSALAIIDSCFVLIGNIILLLLNMSHPSVFLALSIIVFVGIAAAVVCAIISHLLVKAAHLKEQSDLTI